MLAGKASARAANYRNAAAPFLSEQTPCLLPTAQIHNFLLIILRAYNLNFEFK
jgi:hypothetical protein